MQPGHNFFGKLTDIICSAKPELTNIVEPMFYRFVNLKENKEGYSLSIHSNKIRFDFGNFNKIIIFAPSKRRDNKDLYGVVFMDIDVPEINCATFYTLDFSFDDFKELYIHALRLKADRLSSEIN